MSQGHLARSRFSGTFLGKLGANVVVDYVKGERTATEVVQSIVSDRAGGAIAVRADLSTFQGDQIFLKAFGGTDILLQKSWAYGKRTLSAIDEDMFDAHMNIHVTVPLFIVKATVPLLPSRMSRILLNSFELTWLDSLPGGRMTFLIQSHHCIWCAVSMS